MKLMNSNPLGSKAIGATSPGSDRAQATRFVTLLAVGALLLAACGGSEAASSAPVIVVESSGSAATGDSAGVETDEGDASLVGSDEDRALAFAQCVRDEGVDFPDPEVNADGSIDFLRGARQADADGLTRDPEFRDAMESCSSHIDGASFLPGRDDRTEMEDSLLEAAQCLRDNGLDVPDPDLTTGPGGGGGGPFGPDFDPNDPATIAAIDACEDVFTNIGAGRGGGS